MSTARLTKHHGLGNDFLVLIDPEGPGCELTLDAVRHLAVRACDRRRGIGADGLLYGRLYGGVAVDGKVRHDRMFLFNADGSRLATAGWDNVVRVWRTDTSVMS